MELLDTKDLQKELDRIALNDETELLEVRPERKVKIYASRESKINTFIEVFANSKKEISVNIEEIHGYKDHQLISLTKESAMLLYFILKDEIEQL